MEGKINSGIKKWVYRGKIVYFKPYKEAKRMISFSNKLFLPTKIYFT